MLLNLFDETNKIRSCKGSRVELLVVHYNQLLHWERVNCVIDHCDSQNLTIRHQMRKEGEKKKVKERQGRNIRHPMKKEGEKKKVNER